MTAFSVICNKTFYKVYTLLSHTPHHTKSPLSSRGRDTAQGVNPMPDKLQAIRDWPTPHCLRDVRAFVGLASYYRRFVPNFASIAEPLTRLTKKNNIPFKWTDDADHAFRQLKDALLDATTLAFPIPGTHAFWIPTPQMLLLAPSCPRSSME